MNEITAVTPGRRLVATPSEPNEIGSSVPRPRGRLSREKLPGRAFDSPAQGEAATANPNEPQIRECVSASIRGRATAPRSQDLKRRPIRPVDPPLLTPEQAAIVLGTTVGTLRQWRYMKHGPKPLKLGRSVFYPRADLLAYASHGD